MIADMVPPYPYPYPYPCPCPCPYPYPNPDLNPNPNPNQVPLRPVAGGLATGAAEVLESKGCVLPG